MPKLAEQDDTEAAPTSRGRRDRIKRFQTWLDIAGITAVAVAFSLIVAKNAPSHATQRLASAPATDRALNPLFIAWYETETGGHPTGGSLGERPAGVHAAGLLSSAGTGEATSGRTLVPSDRDR